VLRASGFPVAVTYDPMTPEHAHHPQGKFELVTCFETLEHLPDPAAGIASILEYVADPGLIFFTTLVQPGDFNNYGLHWWYVGPRNGHVSIFSKQALTRAFGRHDYKLVSFNDNVHLAFRTLPPFLAHLDTSVLDQPNK
jgi:SAM-dependent methyltransferase